MASSTRTGGGLHRELSARQVQMIAIGGTIGTGLFLGSGKSLAEGGPASMLICYSLVGAIVYVTLLLLGEMATQYPVAGSFTAYTARFVSPSYAFALGWNYWLNDAVSLAGDLTAAQLVLRFWLTPGSWWHGHTWILSVAFWGFLVGVNAVHVKAYGEMEYWLSSLKVLTILIFILTGIAVNIGANPAHEVIGFTYWRLPGAPFVGGFGGFVKVFVTASFAYGGTESLGITAGETRNPSKNMPKVVKAVFWRILLFYIISIFLIGINVPYTYPDLSTRSATTSPFTLVFAAAGSRAAASVVNTVVLSSVLSAGNHALFAGTRVLHSLAQPLPGTSTRQAPALFARTTARGVPLPALAATASVSALALASSYVGSGVLWGWLQNVVGVSNQIAWLSIGAASWRFRTAWVKQGRSLEELKFTARWTWGWGPPFVVVAVTFLILFQGYSSFVPRFSPLEALSLYAELPIMLLMWILWPRSASPSPAGIPGSPTSAILSEDSRADERRPLLEPSNTSTTATTTTGARRSGFFDWVDLDTVDLNVDEYDEPDADLDGDGNERAEGGKGWKTWARHVYEWIA